MNKKDKVLYWIYTVKCRGCKKVFDYIGATRDQWEWLSLYNYVLGAFAKGFKLQHCDKCDKYTVQDLISMDGRPE